MGSKGVTFKFTVKVWIELELLIKVKFEFAAFGVTTELEQLEQLVGLVTLQEYETGTGVLPHIGNVELLERLVVAGEHCIVE